MQFFYQIMEYLLPFSWVESTFMKDALLAIMLITPLFGLVGTMIVNNKMAFFSDALGHSALTGIAIGVLLGMNDFMLSMMGFSIIFALGISAILGSEVSSSDTVIGVFSSAGISLGIVILSAKGGFAKYSNYLIGDILLIKPNEIVLLAIVLVIVILMWILMFNKLMLASVSADLAISKRVNTKFYKNIFMVLIALIVTITIKWVGMLIINSLLVLPAASSRNISRSMKSYHIFSVIFSIFSGVSGLILSYYINTSASATIVLISSLMFFTTFFIGKNKR